MGKVAIETYGCTMNQADSDIMRGVISKKWEISDVEEADVVVINSCGVVEFTERKIVRRVKELKRRGKKVVLAGCLGRINSGIVDICDAAISPDRVDEIDLVVAKVFEGEKVRLLKPRKFCDKATLHDVKKRLKESVIAIVSISEGCLGSCTFCATRFARGRLRSFSAGSIVEEVEKAVRTGFREIQLTSQDTGAYGMDRGRGELPDLLRRISKIDGEFRVRVGMMNPQHARAILDDLIDAFSSDKIYKFLHVPVQSGDDRVLKDMGRGHSVEDFIEVVEEFRKNFDDIVLSTDIIVGFPTESEDAFWRSYDLIKDVKPDIVNITRYSQRNNTPAARMGDIPGWVKKSRSRILTELCRKIGEENNSKFIGRKLRVLITKKGKNNMLSRTDSYRPVITQGEMGEFRLVSIIDSTFNYLVGI